MRLITRQEVRKNKLIFLLFFQTFLEALHCVVKYWMVLFNVIRVISAWALESTKTEQKAKQAEFERYGCLPGLIKR